MTSNSFPCPSLDGTRSQIRLLEIHLQPDESLRYSLRTFDIEKSPPYVALSYTWGNDEPANTIIINEQACRIRNNLSSALPRLASLRNETKSQFQRDETYFWIDAICINQEDTRERNHQVSMMADIFKTATLTVAWLGAEDVDFQLLSESLLAKIACKEYFRRMWIIQEIVLSQEIWVMCGSGICAWQTLQSFWLRSIRLPHKTDETCVQTVIRGISDNVAIDPLDSLHSTMGSKFMHNKQHVVRLDDLVHLYFDRECRDPRDRIYALLGLLPPQVLQSNPIPVDYDISLEALFLLVRKHFHQARPRGSEVMTISGSIRFDYARDLQKALEIAPAFRIQCESRLIEEGFFRDA